MISPRDRLVYRVRQFLDASLPDWVGTPVLVGCSGGGDSVALALALAEAGVAVSLAHLDHGVRPDSAEDARWVVALAAERGWPCHVRRVALAGGGFEARAREARLAFLTELAGAQGIGVVALGHHREDQAETVLFRLARGSGIAGLGGMAPARELRPGLRLVRPLLGMGRRELRDALDAWGQAWLEDPSNETLGPARNRVRHLVMPALSQVHPGAADAVGRAAELLRLAQREAEDRAAGWLACTSRVLAPGLAELAREPWLALPPGERGEVLRHLARQMGRIAPGREAVAALEALARTGQAGDVEGGWRLGHQAEILVLRNGPTLPDPQPLVLGATQETSRWGWRIDVGGGNPGLVAGWGWRTARPGEDHLRPPGSDQARPLGRWLRRRGVPLHVQETLLVLASGPRVAWVVGLGGTSVGLDVGTGEDVQMQATACFRV
ncbi:MAG: tRNA lysidine(34) synthetase TilS [Candidatus Sericytochromatia bacterium]|nr:tRNA lysidine(34) synthetase TilS [Candidatus Sericytochromatia bacterium]